MQAIRTHYVGPRQNRGSRIIAKCQAGSVSVTYEPAMNVADNHEAAAKKLAAKLGWTWDFVPGDFDGKTYWVPDDGRLKALKGFVNSMRAGTWSGNPWSKPEFRKCVEAIGRSYGFYGEVLEAPTTDEEAAKLKGAGK